jgi:hypothetical protein
VEEGRRSKLSPEEHAALLEADAEICALLRFHGFAGFLYEKWEWPSRRTHVEGSQLAFDPAGHLTIRGRAGT